jgi:hypothetical protein
VNYQEAYDKLTRVGRYLCELDVSRTMELDDWVDCAEILDSAQRIIRLESILAGREVV